jgi:hypothetical protein
MASELGDFGICHRLMELASDADNQAFILKEKGVFVCLLLRAAAAPAPARRLHRRASSLRCCAQQSVGAPSALRRRAHHNLAVSVRLSCPWRRGCREAARLRQCGERSRPFHHSDMHQFIALCC